MNTSLTTPPYATEQPHQQLIWAVRLASDDSLPKNANSKKMVRTNIWETETKTFLSASQLSRKVVESTADWMLKIVRRLEVARVRRSSAVVINYGCGYATLVLCDDATLPSGENLKTIPRVGLDVVVASMKSENSAQTRANRLDEYGVLTPSDEVKDHLNEGRVMHPDGVRLYLHPNESDCGLEGFWGENGDRKRIYRVWSQNDNLYAVNEMTRCRAEEQLLRSRAGMTSATLPPTTPQRSVAGGSVSGESPFKPLPPRRSSVKRTIPTADESNNDPPANENHSSKKRPVPEEIDTGNKSAEPEAKKAKKKKGKEPSEDDKEEKTKAKETVTPRTATAKKNEKTKAKETATPSTAASKKNEKKKDQVKAPPPKSAKKDEEEKSIPKAPGLGFSPREVLLLALAFERELREDELKRKIYTKDKTPVYTMTDVRAAKKIMKSLENNEAKVTKRPADSSKKSAEKKLENNKAKAPKRPTDSNKKSAEKKPNKSKTIKTMRTSSKKQYS